MAADLAIETHQLGRIYTIRNRRERRIRREIVALQDVNLEIPRGELFGLLGPNGAGKTTLIKILTTLLAPTTGWARVAGYDVVREPHSIRPRINMVSGGEASGYGLLTVRENLWMFAQFYGLPTREANRRIEELLCRIGLADRMHTKVSDLSTGLRQKMNVVRGFLTDPEILFLDEPTLGLDVGAARDVRRFIREWMDAHPNRTVLLTTHYMMEADELCDRVAIISQGRVLACDAPEALKRRLQRDARLDIEITAPNSLTAAALEALPGVRKAVLTDVEGGARLNLVLEEDSVLPGVIQVLTEHAVQVRHLTKREPTLEDVFVDLVGRTLADSETGGGHGHGS
ncbi:MAG: ABC transporter ATP-binding protein [Anaerolineae bacterium]|nr:ABC transporter ATP-binding protein [Anaerolineae bacterium]MDW8068191.1 ABC transporter ATP-binding protein [Anaerolineae bacterium]